MDGFKSGSFHLLTTLPNFSCILRKRNCWGDRWGSNPRQPESQSGALPAELRPPLIETCSGVPDRNRTCNPQLRRLVLYPIELRAQFLAGSCEANVTAIHATNVVGVERFELPTSCSQSRRATRLRYTPKARHYTLHITKNQFSSRCCLAIFGSASTR